MILDWEERTYEERHLLNPAFCSIVLWHSAKGAMRESVTPRLSISFLECFLILPMVLHCKTRESLPTRLVTSLPVWVSNNPLAVVNLPERAKSLTPYVKEAVMFGGRAGIFKLTQNQLIVNKISQRKISNVLGRSSEEVKRCTKKAEFLGRWFAHTGSPETVFSVLGVRP